MVPVSSKEHPLSTRRGSSVNAQCLLSWALGFVLSNDQIPLCGLENLLLNEEKLPPCWEGRVQPSAPTKEQKPKGEKPSMKDKFNPIRAPLMSRDTENIHCPPPGKFFLTKVLFFRREAMKTTGWKRVKVFIAMAIHFLQCLQTGPWNQTPSPKMTQSCPGADSNGESVLG